HRNWYVWRDGKGPGQPPNNWLSTFGHSAWKFDPKTGQWYYHYFYPEQPDLNWRNPALEKAMFDVTRWWYQRGVSGFRLDAVDTLSPAEFRKQIAGVDAAGWPVYVLSNHDIVRAYNRYGDGQHNDQIAKVMAGLYLTLRGTPIMYYGEEIGMENNDPKRKEDVKDPIGKIGWPKE